MARVDTKVEWAMETSRWCCMNAGGSAKGCAVEAEEKNGNAWEETLDGTCLGDEGGAGGGERATGDGCPAAMVAHQRGGRGVEHGEGPNGAQQEGREREGRGKDLWLDTMLDSENPNPNWAWIY
jgi:hypothetical protein